MTKILVTGATGTIGKEVVRALRQRGLEVRAGTRTPESLADLERLGAETVRLDYGDPASVKAAFQGVDRVFLLTPFIEESLPLVQTAVAAAREAGAKFLLRMSAAGADPDAEAHLPRQHGLGEKLVKESGIPWAIIRPTFFQDNFVTYAAGSITGQGAFHGASGTGKAAYVSSADVGATAAAILAEPDAHAAHTYEITGGEAVADAEVARMLTEILGREIAFVSLSAADYGAALRSMQLPEWMVESLVMLEGVKANGWAEQVSPAVQEITGRAPERIRAFLERNKGRLA